VVLPLHLLAGYPIMPSNQLHRNIEAYVDDMVIKTRVHNEFIPDLEETFNSLRKF
jgi:hypothetical protein